jgi:hypothetical protein
MDKSKKHIKINQKGGIGNPFKYVGKKVGEAGKGVSKAFAPSLKPLDDAVNGVADLATPDQETEIITLGEDSELNDAKFWDNLWEEPCWIKEGENFSIHNLKDLWFKWHNEEVIEVLKKVRPEIYKLDKGKCRDEYNSFRDAFVDWDDLDIFDDKYEENMDKFSFDDKYEENMDKIRDEATLTASLKEKKKGKIFEKFCPNEYKSSQDIGSKAYNKSSKFMFCLIIKFLLGPAGFFILKMIPHIIRFYFTMMRTISRFGSHARGWSLPFVDEEGKFIKEKNISPGPYWLPAIFRVILSYLGTVIPFQFISHNSAAQYGRGEFGKLIVGLTAVSAGIILMGGLGISVILICFLFYCAKVIGMFSDNVTETKKK